jgi:hypothetical protein
MLPPFGRVPFNPMDVPGLGLWLRHDLGLTLDVTAFAGTGTVSVAANVGTFSTSQDGVIVAGDTVTIGATPYLVGARTSGTVWALTGANVGASAFTVTKQYPRVTAWADQSGNGRHVAQATASLQPLYQPNDGFSAPYFDGTNDVLTGNAAFMTVAQNVPGFTLFTVERYITPADGVRRFSFFLSTGLGAGPGRVTHEKDAAASLANGSRTLDGDSPLGIGYTPAETASVRLIHAARYQYLVRTLQAMRNGRIGGTTSVFGTAGNTSNTASIQGQIGAANNALYMYGPVLCVIAYQRALLDAEMQMVTRYLGQQYGIPVTNG